jgi:hypothetical protein
MKKQMKKTMRKTMKKKSCARKRMSGGYGPATFSGSVPYEMNKYENAPTNPDNIVSSRMQGGKKKSKRIKRKTKKSKKVKKMKGGSFLLPKMVTVPTHFDTTAGALHNANIMAGENASDPRSYIQPLTNTSSIV